MIYRGLAGLLFLAALLVYAGIALPARRGLDVLRDEFARARDEREQLRLRLSDLERKAALGARLAQTASDGSDAARSLRLAALRSLEGLPVSGVQLTVSNASRPPLGAHLRLSAEGGFHSLLRLSEQLIQPQTGVILDRLRLSSGPAGLHAELEGSSLRGQP